jgi:3-methyladenine DNA glycosylase/8-oxoguanine DNA glycosylase
MAIVDIPVSGPFSLGASIRFLEGFPPARYRGTADDQVLRLAFPVEGDGTTVGVAVRQPEPDRVTAELDGSVPDRLLAQVARILSLDVDGSGYPGVLAADRGLADLAARHPGMRPVCFWSPYEAACYALLSQRTSMAQAATVKERISREHGELRSVAGVELPAFPAPARLRAVADDLPVPEVKRDRLRAVAEAALDGVLDGDRLRSLPVDDALATVQRIPGMGPFSAELVVVRGAGSPDVFPANEGRLHDAMRVLYGLPDATVDDLAGVAARWSPFRSWVAVLIRSHRRPSTSCAERRAGMTAGGRVTGARAAPGAWRRSPRPAAPTTAVSTRAPRPRRPSGPPCGPGRPRRRRRRGRSRPL